MVAGPWVFDERSEVLTLKLRRYCCRDCGAIITSVPRALLRGFIYNAVAIALALSLWGGRKTS